MRSLLLTALLAPTLAAQSPSAKISGVSWLQGCWALVSPQRVIEEQWMAPRGRTMLGMGRTVRGDSLTEFEVVVIRESGTTLVYDAHPSGQAPATFTASAVSDSGVVFENPAHDFPQKVGYRRVGRDSLIGHIEGTLRGRSRRIEFPYARSACDDRLTLATPPPPPPPPPPPAQEGVLSAAARDSLVREVQARRAAWRARGIDHYSLRVAIGCFCPWPKTPAIIEVRGSTVIALRDTTGKSMGKPREPWSLYTVEGLFDAVEQGARRNDMIGVRYDSTYGYPMMMSGDAKVGRPDDWFWVEASRLTPRR